jgi:hypothetical protein
MARGRDEPRNGQRCPRVQPPNTDRRSIMADNGKKGLTPFGWLLAAGTAAFFLSSKERRTKAVNAIKGLGKKSDAPAGA